MKKLLLASLCMATVTLTACDKKPHDAAAPASGSSSTSQPAATSFSTGKAADIKSDLMLIQNMSTTKAKEALTFQSEVTQAAQKGDKAALQGIVGKMKTYVDSFNADLDALSLKSSEVDSVRKKMKESNNLGVELSEAGLSSTPDMNKITELQKKATELQQSLLTDMQNLQNTANTAK